MLQFPAVIIGGPPNSGKSVLTAHLTQALRQRGCQHYVLRANPDGEGDWTHWADPEGVRSILVPHTWTPEFVTGICTDIAQRHLPLLVDVGGRPQPWQEAIFVACTHAILLTPDETAAAEWRARVTRHNLQLLADLRSALYGVGRLDTPTPIICGVVSWLEGSTPLHQPAVAALLDRLTTTLFAYDAEALRQFHLRTAPVELSLDLDRLARTLHVPYIEHAPHWKPDYLPAVYDYLPERVPLALYGRAPNWLYCALAALASPAPLFQFDPRLGWVQARSLAQSTISHPDLRVTVTPVVNGTHLAYTIPPHLDYAQLDNLVTPKAPLDSGIILSGRLPLWLYTSLARTYQAHPWIAVYQPQLEAAVVVHSTESLYSSGACIHAASSRLC